VTTRRSVDYVVAEPPTGSRLQERRSRALPGTSAPAEVPLQTLLSQVIRARAALADGRHANIRPAAMDDARAQMVMSLEAYTCALHSLHLPVPYSLRDELRAQRSAYGNRRGYVVPPHPDSAAGVA
jgi:hypothetical protein